MVFVVPGDWAAAAHALCVVRAAACPLSCCIQYHNKFHSSTLTHHVLRQMAANSLFVCLLLCGEAAVREHKLSPPFWPHVAAKVNLKRNVFGAENLCRWGASTEAPSGSSCARDPAQLQIQQGAVLSRELQRWNDNNQSALASTLRCHILTSLCSLECSYARQLPLEFSSC